MISKTPTMIVIAMADSSGASTDKIPAISTSQPTPMTQPMFARSASSKPPFPIVTVVLMLVPPFVVIEVSRSRTRGSPSNPTAAAPAPLQKSPAAAERLAVERDRGGRLERLAAHAVHARRAIHHRD